MRIAQIAPLAEAVPPRCYGGTERVVAWLTEGLVERGHEVTLFASGDSVTTARLVACVPQGLRDAGVGDPTAGVLAMLENVRNSRSEFDILHFHLALLPLPVFRSSTQVRLTTMHGRMDLSDLTSVYGMYPEMPLVSISRAQRDHARHSLNWVAMIHHGLPAAAAPFNPDGGAYLAFLGRISPEKRPDRAIEIALRTGIPIKIAAKIDHVDRQYFQQVVAPYLDNPLVDFIGEIDDQAKGEFLGRAQALLFPIDWPEPFGLVMIEAMSAGTPVIAWRAGSVQEIVDEGVTGFIVDTMDAAAAAVGQAAALPRDRVRQQFESRFTAGRMVDDYVGLYERLLGRARPSASEAGRSSSDRCRVAEAEPEAPMHEHPHEDETRNVWSEYEVAGQTSVVDRPQYSLKHGEAFLVVDCCGNIGTSADGAEGLFFKDTRYLSRFDLRIEGRKPVLLSASAHQDKPALSIDLTNPDLDIEGEPVPRDTIALERTRFVRNAVAYERVKVRNYGRARARFRIDIGFACDFRDLFEVRA